MIHTQRSINGVEVKVGAMIPGAPISTYRFFGKQVETAAECLAMSPHRWRAILIAGSETVWTGGEHPSDSAAINEAQAHARQRVSSALRVMFE